MKRTLRLPRRALKQIAMRTLVLTLLGMAVSLLASHIILTTFSGGLDATGVATALLVPILLGGPMIFYLSLKNHELQFAYRRLEAVAARDSLTNCLNHGAFVTEATAFLSSTAPEETKGALLIIDADHFKSVNDRFGHDYGDQALKQIAARIRAAVRPGDLVGRVGGEEFCVLLPGASQGITETIAESIRRAVQNIAFSVEGTPCPLSVSIGGAVFEARMGFGELFRCADKRLYNVKNAGRNTVDLIAFSADSAAEFSRLAQAS